MRARRWWWTGLGIAIVAVLAVSAVVLDSGVGRRAAPPAPPPERAVVALGDSIAAGEGAGRYVEGTDGRGGNFCHRSANAEVTHISTPGLVHRFNLGCSGAGAGDLDDGGPYGEPPQLDRLADIARGHRVGAVVVTVGANDNPRFVKLISRCVRAYFTGSPCTDGFGDEWSSRVDAMVPKVTAALRDVRATMRDAGYSGRDYQLVLQSYAAPVGPGARPQLRNLSGCPFTGADLRWVAGPGVRTLDDGLRRAARAAGARYLDMSRAGNGHGACSGNGKGHREWFSRLSIDWQDLQTQGRAEHAASTSFHPNATGYRQFARCLSGFLAGSARTASCVGDARGNLHPSGSTSGG